MPKALESQRDFSAGEIDVSAKRSDQSQEIAPLLKAGLRQCSNMRIRNSKALRNRPGRSALFIEAGRVEKVLMSPGNYFYLAFGNHYLRVYTAAGAQVFTTALKGDGVTAIPWTTASVKNIVWCNIGLAIYITYGDGAPANVPQILSWDGVATWTLATFAEAIGGGGQKRTPFYRISPRGVTMQPSATSGVVNLTFSAGVLVAGHVGTRMRFCGRQLLIKTVFSSVFGTATVIEPLPPGQQLTVSNTVGQFNIGDEMVGDISGAKGIVTQGPGRQVINYDQTFTGTFLVGEVATGGTSGATGTVISFSGGNLVVALLTGTVFQTGELVTSPHGTLTSLAVTSAVLIVQLLQTATGLVNVFLNSEVIAGPSGSAATTAVATVIPQAVLEWDDEVMNTLRGYPQSCFNDQSRFGLCNFPSLPNAISWSAINNPSDLYVGAQPSDGFIELAPDKVQIYHVLAGPESSEFVFANRKIYYIPISVTNPLEPGRVAFNILSSSGALPVQPRLVDEDVVYVDSQNTINSITAPGMYYRPYGVRNLTEVHTHLIRNPIAIAVPTQQGTFAESHIYVLNPDGTAAVGKYETENGQIKGVVGWVPWTGAGTVSWLSATDEAVIFTTAYVGPNMVEALDDTVYLDATVFVNATPAALAPPGGALTGPLWFWAGLNVDLMDQDTRAMGTYQIDVHGNIVPQNNGGENLAAASLVAGLAFSATIEPFVPPVPPGPDAHQRMTKRRITRLGAYVSRSSGFAAIKIASRIGPLLPPVGTVSVIRRWPAWNQGDDPTLPPPLRETAYHARPAGRDYDPRAGFLKDTPGPWEVLEIPIEAST